MNRISYGGAIVAALYLDEFVGKRTKPATSSGGLSAEVEDASVAAKGGRKASKEKLRWIHVDFMGFNQASRPGRPEGGEAQGMRALFSLLKDMYGGSGLG